MDLYLRIPFSAFIPSFRRIRLCLSMCNSRSYFAPTCCYSSSSFSLIFGYLRYRSSRSTMRFTLIHVISLHLPPDYQIRTDSNLQGLRSASSWSLHWRSGANEDRLAEGCPQSSRSTLLPPSLCTFSSSHLLPHSLMFEPLLVILFRC